MPAPSKQSVRSSDRLNSEELERRTFQRAVKLLAARPLSVAELRERLLKGRRNKKRAVETVIERLKEYGYLDDERYAFGYASIKVKQGPVGRQRLKRDLIFKKANQEVAGEALDLVFSETSEEELTRLGGILAGSVLIPRSGYVLQPNVAALRGYVGSTISDAASTAMRLRLSSL